MLWICGPLGWISLAWLDGCPNYTSPRLQETAAKSAHVQEALCKTAIHALISGFFVATQVIKEKYGF